MPESSSSEHTDPPNQPDPVERGSQSTENSPSLSTVEQAENGKLAARPRRSLSPSRASDFMTCPLLYRFRTIDRLPERPSVAAARGTLVHSVLERLYDAPRQERSLEAALLLVEPAWEAMVADKPDLGALLFGPDDNWLRHLADEPLSEPDHEAEATFLGEAKKLVEKYFRIEDPRALEPQRLESAVSFELDSGLTLRGIIDRVDKAPSGEIRIVDYKTGRSPRPAWEGKALFQMRFYGLVVWRMTGQMPARLQLIYLGNEEILALDPTESQLEATQAKIEALWQAIEKSGADGNWQPKASKLCDWCSFRSLCPEWGGTPPPLPEK